ncbi:MAG: DUF3352 domain-containing protein, partial [Nostocaceae cyanobacterium]|nr:DUF3352 domain-containing protein [Nostocaceae cyanobacterium]
MAENKSKFLIPAIGAVALVAGSIAAYMYFFRGPSGGVSGALASAKIVPDNALMATFISTDPQAWSQLQKFGTPEAQKIVTKSLQDITDKTLTENHLSYEKDLKPWIGGVMIAVLPPTVVKPTQATPPKTEVQNVLIVVGIKDKISALNFANKLKEDKSAKFQEKDYKGEKIIESNNNGKAMYSAVLDDHLVVAPEKRVVEQAIDTFKGQPSFANKQGVDNLLSQGVDVENTLAQIYVSDYAATMQMLATNPNTAQLPPQTLAQIKQVKSVVAGVGVDNAGLRLKARAKLDPQAIKFENQTTNAKVVSQFPLDTIALVNGQGISRSWSTLVEQSKNNPQFQDGLNQARSQLKTANLDLDKDIFGWMDGEFAFGLIPSNQGFLQGIGFGGAFVFDTSDRKTAEATLTKLDTLAKSNTLNVVQRNVGGKQITDWQAPQGALISHGWLDNNRVFLALGSPVVEPLSTSTGDHLNNSPTFKAVTSTLQ